MRTRLHEQANVSGSIEDFIQNGQIVVNETVLRKDEYKQYDRALVTVARRRLNGIEDLRRRGLTVNLGGVGVLVSMWERIGDMTDASVSMDGLVENEYDRATYDNDGVPVPIIDKMFKINWRFLNASRRGETPLDTGQQDLAARIVIEKSEDMLFNGVSTLKFDGRTVYGYTTHPNRNMVTITDWVANAGANPGMIISDVQKLRAAAHADHRYGPFLIYVAGDIWVGVENDYSANKGTDTIKERIERFTDIEEVKYSDSLADGTVVMVQMTSDTIDWAVAQDMRRIQWGENPFTAKHKVFTVAVPRIKVDRNNSSGIVHGTQ